MYSGLYHRLEKFFKYFKKHNIEGFETHFEDSEGNIYKAGIRKLSNYKKKKYLRENKNEKS